MTTTHVILILLIHGTLAWVPHTPTFQLVVSARASTPGGRYTYTEGDEFDNAEDEIAAIGGDPAFLADSHNDFQFDSEEIGDRSFSRDPISAGELFKSLGGMSGGELDTEALELEEMGGDPAFLEPKKKWEWDGVVDEDAYFDD